MSNSMKENGVPAAEAIRALERILVSRVFVSSSRLSHFLRYTVERTLSGNADELKEYTIGTNAYGRKSDFDPSHDTIVRTEARRLRRKLVEYYEGEGQKDEVVIFFRSGSYVPVIHWREAVENPKPSPARSEAQAPLELWKEGDGVWVTVAPFAAQPEDPVASSFAFGIEEEILHRMIGLPGIRTFSDNVPARARFKESEAEDGSQTEVFQVAIMGTVRSEQNRLRVTTRVVTASGLVLWSQRYDAEVDQESLLKMQEAIASALLNHIAPREPLVRRFSHTPTDALYKLYADVLTAESLLEEGSIPNTAKALAKFEELKAKAPDYPRLDCGIAQSCIGLAHRGDATSGRLLERAASIGRELLAQWPDLPEAHSIMAMIYVQRHSWKAAETSFERALTLGRQHAIHRQFAAYLLIQGRYDEAWEHLQMAQSIDRFSNRQKTSMGHFFYCSGWHDEARAYYSNVVRPAELQMEPAYTCALTHIEMGEAQTALEIATRLEKRLGGVPTYLTSIAELFAHCGQEQKACDLIARGGLLSKDAAVSSYRQGCLALAMKDSELAIDFFKRSMELNEPEILWILAEPRFGAIKDHPVYKDICACVLEDSQQE